VGHKGVGGGREESREYYYFTLTQQVGASIVAVIVTFGIVQIFVPRNGGHSDFILTFFISSPQ